ncbi:MAG TPA: FAD-dependent oxidoreductase, partial [Candidatus Kryptobacter bacterium]|nr:FAD-dependent oxidoreductase [Candidatus Kryptobacter bacterium]
MYNIVIIGGMAAGCKAAARLSRLSSDYRITIIEKGPFISFSSCGLPLYASGEIDGISDLSKTSYGIARDEKYFGEVKGVRVLTETEAREIDAERREVRCKGHGCDETIVLPYDSLIFATGSEAVKPDFPCASSPAISSFHSPSDAAKFRKAAQEGKVRKAVVIGGGFVGCEMIEALSSLWGIETVLVEKEESLLSGSLDEEISTYLESCIKSDKVKLLLSTAVDKIETDENGSPVVVLENGQRIPSDYTFYCLGVKPNAGLARKSGIRPGIHGGILVDDQMRTNVRKIWAAGDCAEIKDLVTGTSDCLSFGSLSNRLVERLAKRHSRLHFCYE